MNAGSVAPVALYLSILAAGLSFVLRRRETVLLRGERVLGLNAVFMVWALLAGGGRRLLVFWTVALVVSLAARGQWFLLRNDPAKTAAIIESSLGMLLIPFERSGAGYRLELAGGAAQISLFSFVQGSAILAFRGNRRRQKIRLLRALLAKRFRPVFPRPSIDLR